VTSVQSLKKFCAERHYGNRVLSALVRALENPKGSTRQDIAKLGKLMNDAMTRWRQQEHQIDDASRYRPDLAEK
jgi:hypothetical protein